MWARRTVAPIFYLEESMGLKNIDLGTLIGSKTFWGGLGLCVTGMVKAYATYKAGDIAGAITEAGMAISALLAAVGLKDATSGPVN